MCVCVYGAYVWEVCVCVCILGGVYVCIYMVAYVQEVCMCVCILGGVYVCVYTGA